MFEIPVNNKFCVISLQVVGLAQVIKFPLCFDGTLWALSTQPFEVNGAWQKDLGVRANHFKLSNLFLVGLKPSPTPEVMDGENEALERQMRFLYIALAISGLRFEAAGLMLNGSKLPLPAGVQVRSVNDTSRMYHSSERGSLQVKECDLVRAAHMAANLTALYAREPTPRLLKGIRSFVSGLESQHGEQRLHGFVRALDGVTKLPRGKSEREFVKRCQIFTGSTTRDQKLLSELYRLRSAGEHLNPFELELSQYLRTDWEAVTMRRTQQAEALARHVFVRILSSHEFVDRFSQDEWLDVLWAKSSAEIMEAWGEQVDLH